MMASPPVSSSNSAAEGDKHNLLKKIRGHEVAIAELNSLSPSRAIYQKSHNVFFKTTLKAAAASEQTQLDLAKGQLQKLN